MQLIWHGGLNFRSKNNISWIRVGVFLFALVITFLMGFQLSAIYNAEIEFEALNEQHAQATFLQDRANNIRKEKSQDEVGIAKALVAQKNNPATFRPVTLQCIEQAWSPRLALLAMKLDKSGMQVSVDVMVADLYEVFQFVERLNLHEKRVRAMLLNHEAKLTATGQHAIVAKILVEQPSAFLKQGLVK